MTDVYGYIGWSVKGDIAEGGNGPYSCSLVMQLIAV